MNAKIIDGCEVARLVRQRVRGEVAVREARGLAPPCLAVVLVGENPASETYVRMKLQAAEQWYVPGCSQCIANCTTHLLALPLA
jgi:methylenetetrahydrofolate dehydrogenase (NADP+)/methenyltetrahydrofolate cyclohydrolase